MTEKEFESLLTAYLDGSIQDDEIIELELAIQENHAFKTRFQEEFRLHTLMREAASTRCELNGLSVGRILLWPGMRSTSFCVATAASVACLLLSALLVIVLYDHSRGAESALGRFLQVSGTVRTTTVTEHHNLLVEDGQTVKEGDRIVCDPDMQSLIELTDGTLLSLVGGSAVTIQRNQSDDIEIFVEQGKVFFEVAEQDPNMQRVVVKTPQAVATVLGTLFSIEVETTWSRADVYEGLVHFRQEQTGDERDISEGQRAEAWADGTLQVHDLSCQGVVLGSPQMVLSPTDDMYTAEGRVNNNYQLYVEGGCRVTYLKFEVPRVETIHTARLHLTQLNDAGQGTLCFYEGSHSRWTEQDQGASHRPKLLREIARYSGVVSFGQMIEVDVSALITQPGPFTIIVALDSDGNDDIAFGSKETPTGPRLVINETLFMDGLQVSDTASGMARLVTSEWPNCTIIKPTDDVYLENRDRINREYLHLEKQRRTSFLRFEVSGKGIVQEARLQLHQARDCGSGTIRFYEGSHSNWTERDLTADKAPFLVREIAQYTGVVGPGDTISVDVSPLVTGPGVYTIIATLDTQGIGDIAFGSKESPVSPKLILKWCQKDQ